MSRSGEHDRRGHEILMKVCLVFVIIGILTMIGYSIKIGLVLVLVSCIQFINEEAKSCEPNNNPTAYKYFISRQQGPRRPALLCMGDSLTHGSISSNIMPEIPIKLASMLGMAIPNYGSVFSDPLWVINCGQNMIPSHVLLHERLSKAMGTVYPDFIMICIGTNDILSIYDSIFRKFHCYIHNINNDEYTMVNLKNNLYQICTFIRENSPKVEIGICTIPPIGEDLTSPINQLVKEYNAYIESLVTDELKDDERITVIPLYRQIEKTIVVEKTSSSSRKKNIGFHPLYSFLLSLIVYPIYHWFSFLSWNAISAPTGYIVFTDGIHLNDTGRDLWVDAIIHWLKIRNITKVMAVKSL